MSKIHNNNLKAQENTYLAEPEEYYLISEDEI
jgi:hypothetical protein